MSDLELRPEMLQQVIADLSVDDARGRAAAADSVVDWISAYDKDAGEAISSALAGALAREVSEDAAEAQLHALAELAAWDLVPRHVALSVSANKKWAAPWAEEYLDFLDDYANG